MGAGDSCGPAAVFTPSPGREIDCGEADHERDRRDDLE
jgi:hypothetical protein